MASFVIMHLWKEMCLTNFVVACKLCIRLVIMRCDIVWLLGVMRQDLVWFEELLQKPTTSLAVPWRYTGGTLLRGPPAPPDLQKVWL